MACLACACLLGGLGTGWSLLLHIGYALLGFVLLALALACAGLRDLSVFGGVERARAVAGTEIEERYTLTKGGPWPAFAIEISPTSREADDGVLTVSLLPGASVIRSRARLLLHRGLYPVAGGSVSVRDPFGLFVFRRMVLQPTIVTVLPRPIASPTHAAAIRAVLAAATRGGRDMSDASPGDLRAYVPGDPPSRIHWRSTARRGTLMVTDPEATRRTITWLLVDLGGEEALAERVAGTAAFLAGELAHHGCDVGGVIAGDEVMRVPVHRGSSAANCILDTLAAVRTTQSSQLERLVQWSQPARTRGVLVLITGRHDYDAILSPLRGMCSYLHVVRVELEQAEVEA